MFSKGIPKKRKMLVMYMRKIGFMIISWAIDHKLIQGYPDGTFKPHNHVTEAEFLAILFRIASFESVLFNIERHGGDIWKNRVEQSLSEANNPASEGEHWSTNLYKASKELNLEIKTDAAKNEPLARRSRHYAG